MEKGELYWKMSGNEWCLHCVGANPWNIWVARLYPNAGLWVRAGDCENLRLPLEEAQAMAVVAYKMRG